MNQDNCITFYIRMHQRKSPYGWVTLKYDIVISPEQWEGANDRIVTMDEEFNSYQAALQYLRGHQS